MGHKSCVFLLAASLCASNALGQTLLRQAGTQFTAAQKAEATLNEKSPGERTRAEYLRVINAYQRVYLITPHTGYADNALTTIARLYEEIKDSRNAIRTLQFLLHDYPQSPFRDMAEQDIARLTGATIRTSKEAAVENIRYYPENSSVRVVVDITGDISFKQGEAKSPERVFVDISPARLSSLLIGKEWVVDAPQFKKIRVAQYDGSTVRVVFDGAATQRVNAFGLKDPNRLVIDISATTTAPPVAVETVSRPPAPPPVSTSAPPPAPVPVPVPIQVSTNTAAPSTPPPAATPPATAADTPRTVTAAQPTSRGSRSLIRSLGLKLSRVVIDAGHGGHDTGSIGPTGYMEKELVLDVAKRLKSLIEAELGVEVVLTRTEDTFVPLESRTEIANKEGADLFISIHANSSTTKSVRGVETFFLNLNTQSRDAIATANRENAAADLTVHELNDLVNKIVLNDKVDESREFAQHVQNAMSKRRDAGPNRGVKQAPFVVLIGATMPSILAEISFISNPEEERQLKTEKYRQFIAESLLQGVRSYSETLSGTKTAKSQEKN